MVKKNLLIGISLTISMSLTGNAMAWDLPPVRLRVERYVSTLGNDLGNGSRATPWRTIQNAINKTPDGGTIYISPGRYNEALTIKKSITLDGAGKDQTFISKGGNNPIVRIYDTRRVTIKELSISGGEPGNWQAAEGIEALRTNLTLVDVAFYDIFNYYVNLHLCTFLIQRVELKESEIEGYLSPADLGIHLSGSRGTIDGLTNDPNIEHVINHHGRHNYFRNGEVIREDFQDGEDLTVRNCILRSPRYDWGQAIRFFGNGENRVVIEDNIFAGACEDCFPVRDNFDPDSSQYPQAIQISDGEFIIRRNQIAGFPTGVDVSSVSMRVLLEQNIIAGNAIGIFTGLGSESDAIYDFGGGAMGSTGGNVIFQNTLYDIYLRNDADAFALNTLWGTNNPQEIEGRIHDRMDDQETGRVIY